MIGQSAQVGKLPKQLGAAYGVNMPRLRRVKASYDPRNLFRQKHILPDAAAQAAE